MDHLTKKVSRKKFLFLGAGISSLLALPAFVRFGKEKKISNGKVKMLTQDGVLVEVEAARIPSQKKKLTAGEIHSWVNRSPGSL